MPTIHTDFSTGLFEALKQRLDEAARTLSPAELIAVFDADGTLWDTDVGETFFEYQLRHSALPNLPPDPWAEYRRLKTIDPRLAYLWLARINEGQTFAEVEEWARRAVASVDPLPLFGSQQELVTELQKRNFEIYVVTASVEWAVTPAAAHFGIERDHVLGVKTKIENGIVTQTQAGPITWREGKLEALLEKTGGLTPVLAAGNTTGDLFLLQAARIPFTIRSTTNLGTSLGETEAELHEIAVQRGWLHHTF